MYYVATLWLAIKTLAALVGALMVLGICKSFIVARTARRAAATDEGTAGGAPEALALPQQWPAQQQRHNQHRPRQRRQQQQARTKSIMEAAGEKLAMFKAAANKALQDALEQERNGGPRRAHHQQGQPRQRGRQSQQSVHQSRHHRGHGDPALSAAARARRRRPTRHRG